MSRRRARGRKINGVLLLDKGKGITSNGALQQVKRLYKARKAGHTGSLDPLASGLLPICLGEATKVSAYLLNADKRYHTEFTLGVKTRTGDVEGEVIETCSVDGITLAMVEDVLKRFRGEIEQIPPMHSAIKYQGLPLYKLAHQGIEVERQARRVVIHELNLLEFNDGRMVVDVKCSKGTYIRTLAEDIGEALGCGAHVSELRRLEVGCYDIAEAVTEERLAQILESDGMDGIDNLLMPMDSALSHWPGINLSNDAAYYMRMGQAVLVPRAPTEGWVRLFEDHGQFLGVGEILDDGRVAPRRILKVA